MTEEKNWRYEQFIEKMKSLQNYQTIYISDQIISNTNTMPA